MTKPVAWNAERYHEVSRPHESWGARVLDRVPREGISFAIDAGCGTGKITRELLDRLPDAVICALDGSADMLTVAARELSPTYGDRVRFVHADLAAVSPEQIGTPADLIFSTATFHWLKDHDDLFRRLSGLLAPGGQLIAQCGGGPNIARFRARVEHLMEDPTYREYYRCWSDTWYFADDEITAKRLSQSGFAEIETGLEYHPAILPDAPEYHAFASTVILRDQLARLPSDHLRTSFVDELTSDAADDDNPFELDYWRLNIFARRPA